jgi:hypothetical protein
MTTDNGQMAAFTTAELMEVADLTRRQLQHLEDAGALTPLRKGHGRVQGQWSILQAVGAAYFRAFIEAGCQAPWSYAACAWVSRQHPGFLHQELANKKRALVSLSPDGEGKIIEPYLQPGASREKKLLVAQLDLKPVYERVLKRALELAQRLVIEEEADEAP